MRAVIHECTYNPRAYPRSRPSHALLPLRSATILARIGGWLDGPAVSTVPPPVIFRDAALDDARPFSFAEGARGLRVNRAGLTQTCNLSGRGTLAREGLLPALLADLHRHEDGDENDQRKCHASGKQR